MWGISADKVLGWNNTGELQAINVAMDRKGRPRYRIDVKDLEVFEARRSVVPQAPTNGKRKRMQKMVIEFF